MRLAKATLFLVAPTLVRCLQPPSPPIPVDLDESPAPVDNASSVLLERNNDSAVVRFRIPCPECEGGYSSSLRFDLSANAASNACQGKGVLVNGEELLNAWNGSFGSGSGTIASLSDDKKKLELSINWQTICIPPPSDSSDQQTAQLLSVNVNRVGETYARDDVGFSVSFTQVGSPDILRLCTHPLDILGGNLTIDNWRTLERSERLENQANVQLLGQSRSESEKEIEQLWRELQDLKAQMNELRHRIKSDEHKIRKLLQQDCPRLLTKWRDCRSLGCIVKVSLRTVPEMFRQIRYRFGPLPSSLPEKACVQCQDYDGCWARSDQAPTETSSVENEVNCLNLSSSENTLKDDSGSFKHPIPGNFSEESARHVLNLEFPPHDEVKGFLRTFAIVLLVVMLGTFVFKVYRNTNHCRRRRADLAARREETRARRAYRSAARRLRWKQWWQGRSYQTTLVLPTNHSLGELRHVEHAQQTDLEANPPPEQGAMQAEILSLRRVLEFVGELVGNNDNHDADADPSGDPPRYTRHEVAQLPTGRYSTADPAPSSTAGLTTINSPRTSSLMSLDTVSSLTLDTLESADTDPPSYSR